MPQFSGFIARVIHGVTKAGQEVRIIFSGVDLDADSGAMLLAMQKIGSAVSIEVSVKPNPQLGIGEFEAEQRPTFGPTLVGRRGQ
jgi:hypothetical protein